MAKKLIWVVLALFLLFLFFPKISMINELRAKNERLLEKINELKKTNEELKDKISSFKKDKIYQEEMLRNKMGIVKKGETIYKVKE